MVAHSSRARASSSSFSTPRAGTSRAIASSSSSSRAPSRASSASVRRASRNDDAKKCIPRGNHEIRRRRQTTTARTMTARAMASTRVVASSSSRASRADASSSSSSSSSLARKVHRVEKSFGRRVDATPGARLDDARVPRGFCARASFGVSRDDEGAVTLVTVSRDGTLAPAPPFDDGVEGVEAGARGVAGGECGGWRRRFS